jgi:tRNA A37 methylthiotransferase MiaB
MSSSPMSDTAEFRVREIMMAAWRRAFSCGIGNGRRAFSQGLGKKTFFLETHGCQMNVADSEVVRSILQRAGWAEASAPEGARVLLTNTCSIREKAENKVRTRLSQWRAADCSRKIGVLGCMASRLRAELVESGSADVVAGPDSYRHLPQLLDALDGGAENAMHTQLSLEETYADIAPVRSAAHEGSPTAYVTVMRGCNNMCSYCVVPFTRGRERSRALGTIVDEVRALVAGGVREVVLLGQNVNSYWDRTTPAGASSALPDGDGAFAHEARASGPDAPAGPDFAALDATASDSHAAEGYRTAEGFGNMYKARDGAGARFASLLEAVAAVSPELRVRFTSPHPKDFPLELLQVIARTPNVCKQLHLPAQSGSSSVLRRMRREYTSEAYLALARRARDTIPGVTLSTDLIAGFCGETEAEHQETLALLREVRFEQAFMYAYSLRSRTHAAHQMQDDVPRETKQRRLRDVIDTFHTHVQARNEEEDLGAAHVVLVEGPARKSAQLLTGRTDGNKRVVFAPARGRESPRVGEYAVVRIHQATGHTLRGEACVTGEQGQEVRLASLREFTELAARLSADRHRWLAERRESLAAAAALEAGAAREQAA